MILVYNILSVFIRNSPCDESDICWTTEATSTCTDLISDTGRKCQPCTLAHAAATKACHCRDRATKGHTNCGHFICFCSGWKTDKWQAYSGIFKCSTIILDIIFCGDIVVQCWKKLCNERLSTDSPTHRSYNSYHECFVSTFLRQHHTRFCSSISLTIAVPKSVLPAANSGIWPLH